MEELKQTNEQIRERLNQAKKEWKCEYGIMEPEISRMKAEAEDLDELQIVQ